MPDSSELMEKHGIAKVTPYAELGNIPLKIIQTDEKVCEKFNINSFLSKSAFEPQEGTNSSNSKSISAIIAKVDKIITGPRVSLEPKEEAESP